MTPLTIDPRLDARAAALALTEKTVGWGVADLALEYKRKQEPHWAERTARPFGVGKRWVETLARAAEFCEVNCVAALRPRQNLRVTHWAALAAYWGREGIELEQLLEIAEDAIAESATVMITVEAIEAKLREAFGFPEPERPVKQMRIYSQNVYKWAEQRGPNDALYPRLIACAAELSELAKEMSK